MKTMKHLCMILGSATLTCISAQAAGLQFNITYTAAVQNDANFANIQTAINFVKNEFSTLYSDPITLNYTVDEGAIGLGQSLFSNIYWRGSYATLRTALIADVKSSADATATFIGNLPALDPYAAGPNGWYATSSEAKALGLIAGNNAGSDGTYTFDNTKTYTYDPLNRAVAGKFDFIGVTEHEFSELMGRVTQITNVGFGYDILDTMRFLTPGTRSANPTDTGVYYSFNNGNTAGAGYNSGGGDKQDLNGAIGSDPFNASTGPNTGHLLSPLDVQMMDVIGYDLAAPEPSTFYMAIPLLGLGLLGLRKRA